MLFGLMVLAAPLRAEPPTGAAKDPRWQKRWIYMCSNLYVNENLPKIEAILKRGKAVGYSGLLFADYKTGTWWKLSHAARWKANAGKLRKMTRDLGMELCPAVFPIKRCFEIANEKGGAKPVYVWSDMYDPNHNARNKFYLVNNTIEGSWEGLDPRIIVMKWGGGKIARPGLEFFAGRGHKQMIAGYYDGDVSANHKMWLEAAKEVPDVIGTMYTTWVDKYDDLEKFAEVWWGGSGVLKTE